MAIWKGSLKSKPSWEPTEAFWQFEGTIKKFHEEDMMRASPDQMGENAMDFEGRAKLIRFVKA